MKDAPLRHRVEYAFYRRASAALERLPLAAARRRGARLGALAYRLLPGRRRLVLRNLALVYPDWSAERRRQTALACFRHFGSTFCEVIAAQRLTEADMPTHFEITGWEHLEAAISQGRGVFLTSGHYGNWEVAAMPMALRLGGLHLVARPPDNPHIAADLVAKRSRFGNQIIDKAGAGHRMLSVLRKKGRVAIVIDQKVRPSAGILVPFLGHPAWTSPVVAYLSLHTGAPVVPAFCHAVGAEGYRIEIHPAIQPEGKPGKDAEAALTRRYLAAVETEIHAHPERWMWMHRRWPASRE